MKIAPVLAVALSVGSLCLAEKPPLLELDLHELNWSESLVAAPLSNADKRRLRNAIQGLLTGEDVTQVAPEQLEKLINETRVKAVDLNGDGVPEVMAQPIGGEAGCGATGNCPFWIFKKQGNSYLPILKFHSQVFAVQQHKSNGYRDILLGAHDSATTRHLVLFRFERGAYVESRCLVGTWEYDEKTQKIKSKPVLSPCD